MTRAKRAAYAKAVWIHLNDEVRRIGSGVRPVVVDHIGPKRVKLRSPSNGFVAWISRAVWDQRKEVEKPL
jgi:hypothetical protein